MPAFDINYRCDTCQSLGYIKRGIAGSSVIGNYTYSKKRYYNTSGGLANPKVFTPTTQPVMGDITLESFTYNGVTGYGWHRAGTLDLPIMHSDGIQVITRTMNVHLVCGGLWDTPQTSYKNSNNGGSDAWTDVREGYVDIYLIDAADRTAAQAVNDTADFLQAEQYQFGRVMQNVTTPLDQVMKSCDISQTHAVATHQGNDAYSMTTQLGTAQPVRTATFTEAVSVAKCGLYYTLLLMTDGTVKGFTGNTYAGGTNSTIFGGSTTVTRSAPSGRTYTKIACGNNHYCLVDNTGVLTMYGDNSYGQTTMPYIFDQSNPNKKTCLEIVCGYNHCVARDSSGHVHSWGSNSHGQSTTPAGASGVFTSKVFAGGNSSMARLSTTQIGWGDNAYGQCPASITNFTISDIEFGETNAIYGQTSFGGSLAQLNNFGQGGYIAGGLRSGAKSSMGASNKLSNSLPCFTALSSSGRWFVWTAPTETIKFYDHVSGNCWRVNPAMQWLQTGSIKAQPELKSAWFEWQTGVTIEGYDDFGSLASGTVTFNLVESSYAYSQLPDTTNAIDTKYEVPCGNIGRARIVMNVAIANGECIVQGECPNNQHPNTNLECPADDCGGEQCTFTEAGGCFRPCFSAGCLGAINCGSVYPPQYITNTNQYQIEINRFQWFGDSNQNADSYAQLVSTTANGSNPYNYTYVIKNCGRWNTDFSTNPPTRICGGNYCGEGTYYVTTSPTVCANKPACPCPCTGDTQRTGETISNSTHNVSVTAGSIWRPPDMAITSIQHLHNSWGFRNCAQGTNPPVQCDLCTSCIQKDIDSGGTVTWTFSDAESYPCDCFGTIDS